MAKGKYEYWLTDDGILLLEAWARDGMTDEGIAAKIGINVKTLYDWKNKYSKICNALKKGKEIVDTQVENALLKKALGYEYMEERIEVDESGKRKVTQTLKHVPPDALSIFYWLKNRKPEVWRDKPVQPDKGDNSKSLIEALSRIAEEIELDEMDTAEQKASGSNDVVDE